MNGVRHHHQWLALFLLGIASGLPLVLSTDLLSAWLTDAGFNPAKIGLLGLVGFPYAFKVIWSPLADRFTPPFLGRRRGWMVASQILIVGALILLSLTDPRRSLAAVAIAATAVAFFSATQDIVIDSWRADVLTANQRGPGAAVSVCGYRVGMILSGSGGLILAGHFAMSWPAVCRIVAMMMGVGVIGALLAEEPRTLPPPRSLAQAVGQPLRDLLIRPGGWLILAFVLVFKLPEHLANAMSLPFMLRLGITKDEIGTIRQGAGVAVTLIGAMLGGGIVRQIGAWRSLWIFGLLHSLSNLAFLMLAETGPRYDCLVAVIIVENLCIGMTTAGFIAWMIGQCDARFSAFQFSLLSGIMALGRVLAMPLGGWMVDHMGWPRFFVASALCGLLGVMMLPWLKAGEIEDLREEPQAAEVLAAG